LGTQQRKLEDLRRERPAGPPSIPGAETPLVATEWKKSLWAHVHQLPEGQRQSLVLRFSEELKYEQIATILQCPVGTVKSRIFHGLLALKKSLGQSEATAPPAHPNEDLAHRYGNPAS
jgi:RNA polymerase sigma-70 factor (ECF subfamily)